MRISNIDTFKETEEICLKGLYKKDDTIYLKLTREEMESVHLFSPEFIDKIELDCTNSSITDHPKSIRLSNKDSFTAAYDLASGGYIDNGEHILVLNFASPINPGGGVKRGLSAQEEDLCRKSTLYCSLSSEKAGEYYSYNRQLGDPIYSDYMMISPFVEIFRDSKGDFLDKTVIVSVITAAAPICDESIYDEGCRSAEEISAVFGSRIRKLLKVSAISGYRYLILGAWGCGAFGNDAKDVAKLFYEALLEYATLFYDIEFAVYCKDKRDYNYRAFSEFFSVEQNDFSFDNQ